MNSRQDEFTPYWLQTAMPSSENGEMPGQPVMFPWEYPWPHTAPQTMWPASNPSGSSALPLALPSSPHKGADAIAREEHQGVDARLDGLPRDALTLRGLMPGNLDPSSLYWPQTATPTGVSSAFPASPPTDQPWEWPRQGPASPAQNYPTRFTNTAQTFSEPRAASSSNAPVSSTNAAPSWPAYEFDLTQDALRAGAEKIGRRGRPQRVEDARERALGALKDARERAYAPIPTPAPIPSSPEHVESAQYWGAGPGPSAASEQPVNGFYLSPVGKAPSWEQVVPTATPWSVSPKLPSPTSWGDVGSGVECDSSGGNLHCITPGGRRFTVPAEGLPDGLRIAPGDPDFHYYSTSVGPQPGNLRRPMPGVINDPTPALRSMVRPATPEGTENPAAPWYAQLLGTLAPAALNPLSGSPSWPVRSYTTADQNGTPLVVNVTQPGHPLYPGVVARYGTTSPSGAMIHNEGSGLAVEQGPRSWISAGCS